MGVSNRSVMRDVCAKAVVAAVFSWLAATFSAEAAAGGLAKVTAIQNTVEVKAASATGWSPASVGQSLGAGDRIRTGAGSRAAILYSDQTLHRMNEKSEVEIVAPAGGGSGIVNILSGGSYFTTRTPKDFGRVQTRTVTAAIKGTEFAVAVAETGATVITMIEGTVEASNEHGSVTVTRGEEAVAEPGKAPQRRVVVRPRDAVAWSLYYPQVVGGVDGARLRAGGATGEALTQATSELASGQVDAAKGHIEQARATDPRNPIALALASIVALTTDHRDEARSLADQAMTADPLSPSGLLAGSFVAQADFDLDRARTLAEKAAALDPSSAEAMARAAELRLASGDHDGAKKAAEEAVRRQPDNARALTVLGFVHLAAYQTKDAAAQFDRAVAADSGFALAHAGRGIAQIRLGHVGPGREELQTAVTLDPSESLYRSYLGKAYYEEKRAKEAGKELAAAKDLDPNDPTPYLYSAILLQNENRPIEALHDLNGAIDRNDNRAVYRSRLLVDEDRAVRGADLARIYNDLGFDQLGLVAARRSADENQANFSSHLFLAGNYRDLPGYASSFLSETLQARIYQPVGANAARPEETGGAVAFNEYTALFDRPRLRGFVSGSYWYTDTDLSGLFPGCGSACSAPFEISNSKGYTGNLQGTYNADRVSASLSYQHLHDDGFRKNNEQNENVGTAFVEYAPSEHDTVQLNAIVASRDTGDLPLRQLPVLISPQSISTDEWNIGVGWHHRFTPALDLAVSGIWNNTKQNSELLDINLAPTGISSDAHLDGPQLEGQVVYREASHLTWIAGAGVFDGRFSSQTQPAPELTGGEKFGNAYGYARVRGLGPIEITAGAAVESVDSPVGLLPPRDSFIGQTDVKFSDTQVNPKFGLSATFKSGTTVRATAFSRLASSIGRLQTLEPTQVAGFNQFYEDVGGTHSDNYGVGFDQRIKSWLFFGGSWLHRSLDIPEADCPNPLPASGCTLLPGTVLNQKHSDDELASAYVNVPIGKFVAGSVDWWLDDRSFNTTTMSPLGLFQNYMRTNRYRPQVRVFLPVGFYALVAGTYRAQRVQQFDNLAAPVPTLETARFWTLDAAIGWRLPRRLGSVSLEGTNLTDKEFPFYEQSLQEQVIPARRVALRADFEF